MHDNNESQIPGAKDEYTPPVRDKLYAVSVSKFLMLFVSTLGGYAIYWAYRNWAFYRDARGADVTPVMRGLFWQFFIISLFDRVKVGLEMAGEVCRWYPVTRGVLIILMNLTPLVSSFIFYSPSMFRFVFLIDVIALAIAAYLFVGAQRAINRLAGDPDGTSNSEFTIANILWIMGGGVYWVVALGMQLNGDVGQAYL